MGYPVLGLTVKINRFNEENTYFIFAIGSNKIRYKLSQKYKHLNFFTEIYPSVIIGSQVNIGDEIIVMPNAVINANSQIGQNIIINTGVVVEHDNLIGHCVHVTSSATLCGGARVKDLTHIKAGVTIIQGITIGSPAQIIKSINSEVGSKC